MQPAQEDDNKDGRYFPSDSEMPILIHYLQIYFSHPERSIQRSQVVQNVASILSLTNKHWNHRTIRLWFNNNKRVFYRPTSPQQIQEQNPIPASSSVPTSFSQDSEPPNQSVFTPPPIPKYYLPTRSLSVVQVPTVVDTSQDQRASQFPTQSMNASQWDRFQQPIIRPKRGSFALHLVDVKNHLEQNHFDFQSQKDCEFRTNEKIAFIHDQKWNQIASMHPCKSTIIDNSSISNCQNDNPNQFSFQMFSPSSNRLINQIAPSSSTPPSPPPMPGPLPVASQISNPNSPPPSYPSSNSAAPSSPLSNSQPISLPVQTPAYPLGFCSYDLIEASTFSANGNPIIVSYDVSVQANQIHLNINPTSNSEDIFCPTRFQSSVTSIAYDNEASHLWARSGSLITSFHFDSAQNAIKSDQAILTGSHRSVRSAMTFWDHNLVLSSNSTILTWKPEFIYSKISNPNSNNNKNSGTDDEDDDDGDFNPPNAESVQNMGVCLTLIVPSIDALATVDDYLVVASSEYHTAHIIAPNGACANRAIGHTAGITSLHLYDSNSFITGSADQTAKFWDIRVPVAVYSLNRHKGIITSVFGDGNNGSSLVFTGGTDGFVRVWDIRNMRNVFAFDIGEATPQSIYYDNKTKVLKVITSEKCKDYFYDLGKFSFKNNSPQAANFGLNSIVSFQCVNE